MRVTHLLRVEVMKLFTRSWMGRADGFFTVEGAHSIAVAHVARMLSSIAGVAC